MLTLLSIFLISLVGDNSRLNPFKNKRDDTDQLTNTKDSENQQALPYNPLELPIRPVIGSLAKKIKEALIRLI